MLQKIISSLDVIVLFNFFIAQLVYLYRTYIFH